MQCAQRKVAIAVPKMPNTKPAFLNANGIAKMPVPIVPFKRCAIVPAALHKSTEFQTIVNHQEQL